MNYTSTLELALDEITLIQLNYRNCKNIPGSSAMDHVTNCANVPPPDSFSPPLRRTAATTTA